MRVSMQAFADFLKIPLDEIKNVNNFCGDFEVVTTNNEKKFVSRSELMLFIYDVVVQIKSQYCV